MKRMNVIRLKYNCARLIFLVAVRSSVSVSSVYGLFLQYHDVQSMVKISFNGTTSKIKHQFIETFAELSENCGTF